VLFTHTLLIPNHDPFLVVVILMLSFAAKLTLVVDFNIGVILMLSFAAKLTLVVDVNIGVIFTFYLFTYNA
jgi:hypothetical protein